MGVPVVVISFCQLGLLRMDTTCNSCHPKPYSPPEVDRTWGMCRYYYNIPKAIFYLLEGDYKH